MIGWKRRSSGILGGWGMSFDTSTLPLGEIASVKGGKRLPKGASLQSTPNSHPYIRVRDMGYRYIPSGGLEFVPDEIFPKIKRYVVEENDVIISIVGTIGLVSIIDARFHLASQTENAAKLTGLDFFDAHYLYYYLISYAGQQEIRKGTVGAVQPKLPLYNIEKIQVPWPERDARVKIVNQLAAIDDKLRLNHQINQTLELMAQAIFKSWFVDFEPVKAKITAREAGGSEEDILLAAMQAISGKDEAELARLQAEQPKQFTELRATAELFPSAMQESELGEIPEGWEVLPLSEMVELIGGGTPKKSEPSFWDGDICWFSVKDAPADGNVFVVDTEDKITEEGLIRSSTKLLPIGTTIITARGTVGKLALAGISTAMNQSCYGVIGSDGTGPYLNYLRVCKAVDTLKRNTHGAVFDTITRSTFETVMQPRPGLALRQRFEKVVKSIFEGIKNNLLQSNTLSGARDFLLPKLLSGELSVPGAEEQRPKTEEPADV